jgi:hypothetical protein
MTKKKTAIKLYIIVGVIDGRVESCAMTVILNPWYQPLKHAVICFLKFVEVINSIEL